MTRGQKQVREFHEAFRLTINDRPTIPEEKDAQLRRNLINEEAEEFDAASKKGDIVGVADALADIMYVVYGAAITYGIDLEPVFEEVQRSNMTKLWPKEKLTELPEGMTATPTGNKFLVTRDSDGKVIKSPAYSPANIKAVLDKLDAGRFSSTG